MSEDAPMSFLISSELSIMCRCKNWYYPEIPGNDDGQPAHVTCPQCGEKVEITFTIKFLPDDWKPKEVSHD